MLALPAGSMWTLPGYGEQLEEHSPGLREQMAQMRAPEGFIDVVAALTPIAADDSDPTSAACSCWAWSAGRAVRVFPLRGEDLALL